MEMVNAGDGQVHVVNARGGFELEYHLVTVVKFKGMVVQDLSTNISHGRAPTDELVLLQLPSVHTILGKSEILRKLLPTPLHYHEPNYVQIQYIPVQC